MTKPLNTMQLNMLERLSNSAEAAGPKEPTLVALARRGMAEFHSGLGDKYSMNLWQITEDGRLALEQHRERTGFYL